MAKEHAAPPERVGVDDVILIAMPRAQVGTDTFTVLDATTAEGLPGWRSRRRQKKSVDKPFFTCADYYDAAPHIAAAADITSSRERKHITRLRD